MWIMTVDGAYSITDNAMEQPNYLLVEAVDKESLLAMGQRIIDATKEEPEGVYIKSADKEGVMWRGKFMMFTPEYNDDEVYLQWRMEMPVELLMVYMTIAFDDVEYDDFILASYTRSNLYLNEEIANQRNLSLMEMQRKWYLNWNQDPYAHTTRIQKNYLKLVVDNEDKNDN